ncbi:hypothetical protein Pint_21980 [Pistacia integerrima]|uniref:Uncharacterized protein n=1 Tax=Pistacia integerrima TaxID=434235 RepID=A0ACC0YL35_9ROSI|nr:hypothetical protein Pint_21980 [Pistacia integerrima]
MLSSIQRHGYILTTQSPFVDWLIYQEGNTNPASSIQIDVQQSLRHVLDFVVHIVSQFLYHEEDTMEMDQKLSYKKNIYNKLPREFCDSLCRRWWWPNSLNVNVIAEAFKKIRNPLVIVSLGGNCSRFRCQDAVFVDMKASRCEGSGHGCGFGVVGGVEGGAGGGIGGRGVTGGRGEGHGDRFGAGGDTKF